MSSISCAGGRGAAMEDPDPVFKIRSDCDVAPTTSVTRSRGKLTVRKWEAAFDAQGRLHFTKVLPLIEKGGVIQDIRAQVWEFLLGVYSPSSNSAERKALRQIRREKYFALKEECKKLDPSVGSGVVATTPRVNEDGSPTEDSSMTTDAVNGDYKHATGEPQNGTEESENKKKLIQWKLILHQIGLDVVRTDRVLIFYEDPKNLARLWDILAVYAWIDEEVGYCQGMSDLCSPMLLLFPDEADAFWCFKFLMQRVRENFRCTNKMMGVQTQLAFLASVMQFIDPRLHKCLDALGGSTYIFGFRMLMVIFRREFSLLDTLRLWEMMWASEYHPQLQLLSSEQQVVQVAPSSRLDYRAGGTFAKRNIKYGSLEEFNKNTSVAVFFIAGVLVMLRRKLMRKTQGLDEVVKLLNDMSGRIDARQACKKALKFHKLYLIKVKKSRA